MTWVFVGLWTASSAQIAHPAFRMGLTAMLQALVGAVF